MWRAGYAWQCAYCSCGQHIGWKFTAVRPGLQPGSFWGLRRPALQAGNDREPAPPAGAYPHGSGSEDGGGGWTSGEGDDDEEGELISSGGSPATVSDAGQGTDGEGELLSSGGSPATVSEASAGAAAD
jgi:hypothetical protein